MQDTRYIPKQDTRYIPKQDTRYNLNNHCIARIDILCIKGQHL